MDNIGDRIRLRRHQLGMSVRELAQRVGVSHGTVSKWERGQTNGVSDPNLKKLAKVLDCNILWLIGLDSAITVTDDFETDLEEIPPVRRVPILGEIACGDPILAVENHDGAANVPADSSTMYLKAGEEIRLIDVIYGTMLLSANDGANVIAEAIAGDIPRFVDLMNTTAQTLGCDHSHFVNIILKPFAWSNL